jgi:hypothetical protein
MSAIKQVRRVALRSLVPALALAVSATAVAATVALNQGARVAALSDTAVSGNPDGRSEVAVASLVLNGGQFALGSRVNATRLAGNQFAAGIAINPANLNQVAVLGSGDKIVDDSTASLRQDVVVSVSNDGGQTFTSRVVSNVGTDPALTFDAFGNCFVAFTDFRFDLFSQITEILVSSDGCRNFGSLAAGLNFAFLGRNTLAAVPGGVVLGGVSAIIPTSGLGVIGTPIVRPATLGTLAVGVDGRLFGVTQSGANRFSSNCTITVRSDADGIGPFAPSPAAVVTHSACRGAQIKVDRGNTATRGRVYVFYSDTIGPVNARRDVSFLRFSDDNGATWSSSVELEDGTGNPSALGAIDVDVTGRIAVLNGNTVATLTPPFAQVLPDSPINLRAVGSTRGQVNLAWIDRATNETGYQVERQILSEEGFRPFEIIATLGSNASSFADNRLPSAFNTEFLYRVRALNGADFSSDSNELLLVASSPEFVLAAPTNLVATALAGARVSLSWRDNSPNESRFLVESSGDGVNFQFIGSSPANVTTFVTDAAPNARVFYRVSAQGPAGASDSDPSNVASVATNALAAPNAPTNLTADSGRGSVTLRWRDNSNNETRFDIQRSRDGVNFESIRFGSANVTTFTDSGLPRGVTFFYRVRALNVVDFDTSSASASGFTNVATARTR